MRHMSRRRLLGLAALSPLGLTHTVRAQDPIPCPPPPPPSRPMASVGVAAGQLLRVSLFHDGSMGELRCNESIAIVGLDGKQLDFHKGVISAGTGIVADFDVAMGLRRGERIQCHVNVMADHPVGASAEVVDMKTGATRFVQMPCNETPVGKAPAQMGTIGVVRGQLARISLFHHEDVSQLRCNESVAIVGLDGVVLAKQESTLDPGTGIAFDFDPAMVANLQRGERLQFHVRARAEHPDQVAGVVEVFHHQTGETLFTSEILIGLLVE